MPDLWEAGGGLMQLTVNPFSMGSSKEAALKPLEESAEVFGAWQLDDEDALAYEIADCITACVNLADRYGIDLQAALDAVEKHNRERGRYGDLD